MQRKTTTVLALAALHMQRACIDLLTTRRHTIYEINDILYYVILYYVMLYYIILSYITYVQRTLMMFVYVYISLNKHIHMYIDR